MKKVLLTLLAVLLCGCCLCGCGKTESESQSSAQGNAAPFNMDVSHLGGVLGGAWVNQDKADDRLEVADDLSFKQTDGGSTYAGSIKIDGKGGMMTVTYAENAFPEKAYVWVDSKKQLNVNTWYVDGGTFAFGGKIFIRG